MIERVLESKIAAYAPRDALEQENVLSELIQHYVLVGLARAGLFRVAELHGGTFLRIVHGLDRFSEDLDFVLQAPDPGFSWARYVAPLAKYLADEGLHFEVVDRTAAPGPVKKAFLKSDSIGKLLMLELPHSRDPRRKIRVKLEIDANPPLGATRETRYIAFPVLTAITTQTLASAFASKSHALLCRPYIKGRDWYDFLWYVERGTEPNLELLGNAVRQIGPWAGAPVRVTPDWLVARLGEAVARIDWSEAAADVRRFLSVQARASLALWSAELFGQQVERLARRLGSS